MFVDVVLSTSFVSYYCSGTGAASGAGSPSFVGTGAGAGAYLIGIFFSSL